ncbi:MAG: gamma-glutamyl-gamma-aminobutyrate hydrolase family protein, partial [Clostridia bacterium]|nr:gamma-glutamyl-gamma-aminobutyrate hydrolase family protein [Clostridia bacterium]
THDITLVDGSPLVKITGETSFTVNSFHHQAINSLSAKLTADAYSTNDKYIEAFHEDGHKFLYAYQWHPELMYQSSEISQKIFKAFVDACKEK